jgi:predicted membrane protein DUF2157
MSGLADITREEAQARVDRINAFRAELDELERRGAFSLTDQQRAQLNDYHHTLLAALSERFEVDRSRAESQLSVGLRIVSLIGAVACTAAAVLFFQRFWGLLSTPVQVAVVWVAPLAALAGAVATARVERTLYFTALLSTLAFGCFVMNVWVLGTVLNARPSPRAFLVWSAFAFALAYVWDLRLLLAAGAICAISFFSTSLVGWYGLPLDVVLDRPESVLLPAALVAAFAQAEINRTRYGFSQTLRLAGLAPLSLAVLILSESGIQSQMPLATKTIEHLYQLAGFALATGMLIVGIRRRWTETVNLGAAFFGVLLLLRYVDWWWDVIPKYVFFLIVGLTAIALMVLLRRLRRSAGAAS